MKKKNGKKGTVKREKPITREELLMESFKHAGFEHAEVKLVRLHKLAKRALKYLGKMERYRREEREKTFLEQSPYCIHRATRLDSPAFFCGKSGGPVQIIGSCNYRNCPYIRGDN